MVYRQPADQIAARDAQVVEEGPLLELDVRGRPGEDGQDGADGYHGERPGADGQHGGDAGPAARGEDGGTIKIELRTDGRDGVAVISGETDVYRFGKREVAGEIDFRRPGDIVLIARGGSGGAGGKGGQGGAGGAAGCFELDEPEQPSVAKRIKASARICASLADRQGARTRSRASPMRVVAVGSEPIAWPPPGYS